MKSFAESATNISFPNLSLFIHTEYCKLCTNQVVYYVQCLFNLLSKDRKWELDRYRGDLRKLLLQLYTILRCCIVSDNDDQGNLAVSTVVVKWGGFRVRFPIEPIEEINFSQIGPGVLDIAPRVNFVVMVLLVWTVLAQVIGVVIWHVLCCKLSAVEMRALWSVDRVTGMDKLWNSVIRRELWKKM